MASDTRKIYVYDGFSSSEPILAISVAEHFGITKKEAEDIAWDIRKTVADRWKYLAKSCGLSRGQIEAMAPAFMGD